MVPTPFIGPWAKNLDLAAILSHVEQRLPRTNDYTIQLDCARSIRSPARTSAPDCAGAVVRVEKRLERYRWQFDSAITTVRDVYPAQAALPSFQRPKPSGPARRALRPASQTPVSGCKNF